MALTHVCDSLNQSVSIDTRSESCPTQAGHPTRPGSNFNRRSLQQRRNFGPVELSVASCVPVYARAILACHCEPTCAADSLRVQIQDFVIIAIFYDRAVFLRVISTQCIADIRDWRLPWISGRIIVNLGRSPDD